MHGLPCQQVGFVRRRGVLSEVASAAFTSAASSGDIVPIPSVKTVTRPVAEHIRSMSGMSLICDRCRVTDGCVAVKACASRAM